LVLRYALHDFRQRFLTLHGNLLIE
jgi:hypothetical protein